MHKSVLCLFVILAIAPFFAQAAFSRSDFVSLLKAATAKAKYTDKSIVWTVKTSERDWEACSTFPVLGQTCVEVYVIPQNLTIGIKLIIQNKTVLDEEITASKLCLDDATLLELIADIPELAPFKPIIDYLIELLGFIPAEVFSICLVINNLNVTQHEATGCVDLSTVLMCWEGSCLYKGNDPFGCFDIKY